MRQSTPLRLHPNDGEPDFSLAAPRLIVAGYTGRDRDAVAAHVAELANQTFGAGMYACRPPGMPHGPWHSPDGCLTFEVRYPA